MSLNGVDLGPDAWLRGIEDMVHAVVMLIVVCIYLKADC